MNDGDLKIKDENNSPDAGKGLLTNVVGYNVFALGLP